MEPEIFKKFGIDIFRKYTPGVFPYAVSFYVVCGLLLVSEHGFQPVIEFFKTKNTLPNILLIAGIFLILVVSAEIVSGMTLFLLRLAEGYLPKPLLELKRWRIKKVKKRLEKKKKRLEQLKIKYKDEKMNEDELTEYARLDEELTNYPVQQSQLMPFRLGNIIRAAEEYSYIRYGLEIKVSWPRLWFILPQNTQKELSNARKLLDDRVQLMIWGILFAIFGFVNKFAFLIAAIVIFFAYRFMLFAARMYGQIIRATFDIYRFDLYRAMHWPIPDKPENEREIGMKLTLYLFRGQYEPGMYFNSPKKKKNEK
jgi:hypothetical protein